MRPFSYYSIQVMLDAIQQFVFIAVNNTLSL